jgi:hypothetical protein
LAVAHGAYREFLIPAEIVDANATLQLVTEIHYDEFEKEP